MKTSTRRSAIITSLILLILAPGALWGIVLDQNRIIAGVGEGVARMMALRKAMEPYKDKMFEQASDLVERTQELTHRREFEEEMKFGELSGLGEELPTWYDIRNDCSGDDQRTIVCSTLDRVDKTMTSLFERMERELELDFMREEEEIRDLMDRPMYSQNSVQANLYLRDISNPYGAIERAARDRAHSAIVLDSLIMETDSIIDEILEMENMEEEVSSGRAMQLVAQLRIRETQNALYMTRNEVSALRVKTLEAIEQATRAGFDDRMYRQRRFSF